MNDSELLAVAAVSFAGSLVKSVTGLGYPLVAIPFLALVLTVETAVVVIAIPNVVLNVVLAYGTRMQFAKTRDVPVLATTALLGAGAGTLLLVEAREEPLLIGLALAVFLFVAFRLRAPALALDPATTRRWSPAVGGLAGLSQGAVGVSGPIVAAWLHGYRLPKEAYVLSITLLFLAGGVAQLGVLLAAGAFDASRTFASGVALAATLAAVPAGARLRQRLSAAAFERSILLLLVVSGASLLLRALI